MYGVKSTGLWPYPVAVEDFILIIMLITCALRYSCVTYLNPFMRGNYEQIADLEVVKNGF
jgi:hypothetical protein